MSKPLISGAKFYDFEAAPEFVGKFIDLVKRDSDDDTATPPKKKGDVMGFLFEDDDGEQTIIGNSHQVAKAIGMVQPGDRLYFHWLEKVKNSKGQDVNRFKIDLLEPGENPLKNKVIPQA